MNYRKKEHFRCKLQRMIIPWMALLLLGVVQNVCAQNGAKKKAVRRASMYSNLPDDYTQVGSTRLYYKQYSEAIDMMGYYNGYYYSSTYGDYGYRLAVQVGDNSAVNVDCLNGTTANGVTVQPSVEQQGELARICYTVTNTNETDVVISLGTHADVMIGNNDSAPIERRIDTFGQTYGLTMKDGNGAQLCVLFGSGLAGVTAVSDFWFGYYYLNYEPYQMVGNYSSGDSYMEENGYYDSGMGWCWKDRTITAGSTVVFSYVIGVGEVNLEPNSTFEVTPDDPEGWNDLSRPHRLTLNGSYESPAGLDGVIDYAVEDNEQWTALTDTLASGDEFTGSLVAMFDATKSTHVIRFRTRDLVGNTTLLHPIEYKDVSFHALTGIEEKTYTGDSLFQTNATCDLDESQYELKTYRNNVNAGTASFNIEGVFPYTIGRKTYTFTINPQPFSGELQLSETAFVYNGQPFTPDWQFSNANYTNLEYDKDYTVAWSNNQLPGTGTLTVTGKNNYTGSLTTNINIDKAPLADNLFTLNLPNEDITYDEQSHGASITKSEGVGEATFTYLKQGESERTAAQPTEPGDYAIYLEVADGSLYYGRPVTQVGSFSIYQFNADEWAILQAVLPQLTEMGWSQPWDASQGMKSVSTIQGLNIEKGHVTGFNLANQNLEGVFPYALFALPQLSTINLSHNKLSGDVGMGLSDYCLQNPDAGLNLKELNIAYNQFTGNIGTLCKNLPALQSLKSSNNQFSEVYPMIPITVTEVDLSAQTLNQEFSLHLGNQSAVSVIENLPNILLYSHQQQTYATDLEFSCEHEGDSWDLTMGLDNLMYNNKVETTDYVISRETCVTDIESDCPWEYEDQGKTFLITTEGKVYTIGFQNTVKYSRNHNYTITVPEGLTAYAVRFIGYSNADTNEDCAYISRFDGVDIPKEEIIRFNARNLNDGYGGTVPMVTSRFVLDIPRTGGDITFRFSGQQACAIIVVECSEASSNSSTDEPYYTNISLSCNEGQNVYKGKSGDLFSITANNNSAAGSKINMRLEFDEGDGNFDGQVNVLDLQTNILYIMEKYTARPYNFTAANLWKDEQINVQDIISLVNLLMSMEAADTGQTANVRRNAPAANVMTSDAELYVQDNLLMVNTVKPIAAFDIVVNGASSISIARGLELAGMSVSTKAMRDGLHIIGYALNGACIPSGVSTIGTFDSNASIGSAMLADSEANAISVAIGRTTTGIKDIESEKLIIGDHAYDLQGRKINIPHKGLYIQNGRKVVK